MSAMRAKFQVTEVVKDNETQETVKMMAVSSKPFDKDGISEDNTYARWTPSGTLSISIQNPALIGKYRVGQKLYLDFTEAEA